MTTPAHRTPGCPPAARPWSRSSPACSRAPWRRGRRARWSRSSSSRTPGPLVRWAVPLVRVGHDVAAAVTLGALVFAASLIPDARPPAAGATAPPGR